VIGRALAGLLVAGTVALAARRAHALSAGGATAAVLVGAAAVTAGWAWGALLVTYFVASIALSRLRAAEKAQRTGDVVAKGGARDAFQVIANGGLFAVAAVAGASLPPEWGAGRTLTAAALGALAASAADTWATEIGSMASRPPRSILTGRPVAPGTSGGVNLLGMSAMVAGAAFVAYGGRSPRSCWAASSARSPTPSWARRSRTGAGATHARRAPSAWCTAVAPRPAMQAGSRWWTTTWST
jgi:uncharacterized protein (TIGR00297 family)